MSVEQPEVATLQEFYCVPIVRSIQWIYRLLISMKIKCIHNTVLLKGMRKFSHLWKTTSPLEFSTVDFNCTLGINTINNPINTSYSVGDWDGYSQPISKRQKNALKAMDSKAGWLGCSMVRSGIANFYLYMSNTSYPIKLYGTIKLCSLQPQIQSLGRHNKPCALDSAFHQPSLQKTSLLQNQHWTNLHF